MSEPTSAATGAAIGWKLIGGLAGLGAVGAALATLVVMCMSRPSGDREWVVAITSTVVSSFGLGAWSIIKLGLLSQALTAFAAGDEATLYTLLVAMIGVVFACGLPGWTLIRAVFKWLERRHDKDIAELIRDARESL